MTRSAARMLGGVVVTAAALAPVTAQMPDSPTGRMAGALQELAGETSADGLNQFRQERVSPEADVPEEASGGVVRVGPGGGGGMPPEEKLVMQFFEAYNSGDPERMLSFYEHGVTQEFRSRRSDDEDRRLYLDLWNETGALDIRGIDIDMSGKVTIDAGAASIQEPVRFTFTIDQGRIHGYAVNIGGPPGGGEGSLPPLAIPDGADDRAVAERLDSYLDALTASGMFSGVVLLARDGEPIFHRASGHADRDKGLPNRTDTLFDVGSITKSMTKVAIGQLLRDGKARLDDTVHDHLPSYPNQEAAKKITIAHLLEHRSGLGDIFNDRWESTPKDKLITPQSFFPLFADRPLEYEPGTDRRYSNAGYIVLGAIVEAVSGMPYDQYLEEHVFRPAGMKRSGFPRRDGTTADLAVGYTERGSDGELRPNTGMLPVKGCPAGSSAHTAEDLLRFERALRAGKLLGPGWTEWFFTGEVAEGKPSRALASYPIGIAGGGPGVSAALESDGRTTVIVLANVDPPSGEELSRNLFRATSR